MGLRVAILLLCLLAGGLFGDSGDIVGEAAEVTGRRISVKIVDCDAALLQEDTALFAYLLKHGFSSASTGEALVDFKSSHTRVYRYPDCVLYIRTELTQASTLTAKPRHPQQRNQRSFSSDAEYVTEYGMRFESKQEHDHLLTRLGEMRRVYLDHSKERRKRDAIRASSADPEVAIKFDVKITALGHLDNRLVHDLSAHVRSSNTHASATPNPGGKAPKLTAFTFNDLPWYLDRITGAGGFDDLYNLHPTYTNPNAPPHWVYHVGTGVMRNHIEFFAPGSNESLVKPDIFDVYPAQVNNRNSHETFTAALIAGQKFGRGPRNVIMYPATVLDANGEGWLSDVAAALHAIYYHLQQNHRDGIPVSINLSLGGPASAAFQHELEGIMTRLRNEFDAVSFVSAGNDAVDACQITPAVLSSTVRGVVTVAASTISDNWADFSNAGPCVNAILPGQDILSASNECAACYVQGSGTSFSAPLLHRLYILTRSVNLTASYMARYPPPATHRYYCQPSPSQTTATPTWENDICLNGTVVYGACDSVDHEVMVYDCVNGTRIVVNQTSLECQDGTLVSRYHCQNGTVTPADPEQDTWQQTVVPPAYLPSELALDFLFRFNAQRNVIRGAPRNTINRLISLRPDTFLNATDLPYGDLVTYSFIGNDKPGLNSMKVEVRPYTTLNSVEPSLLSGPGNSILSGGTSHAESGRCHLFGWAWKAYGASALWPYLAWALLTVLALRI